MSELQQYFESFSTGNWAVLDAAKCRCHGNGWALSEVDTWHTCPVHYTGQRHPEDDGEAADEDRSVALGEEMNPMNRNELTDPERCLLQSLATLRPDRGGDRVGTFGWNTSEILRSLADHGLVEYREIPRRDGELLARLTERGLRAYQKGVRLGVYRRVA